MQQEIESSSPREPTPRGWSRVTIGDVTSDVPSIRPEDDEGRIYAYIDISAIDRERNVVAGVKHFVGRDAPSRARQSVAKNDVLFSNVRTYLRNVALIDDPSVANVCSTGFTVLRPTPAVVAEYLFRYVLTDKFISRVTSQQTGTHYPATSERKVKAQAVPLPPLLEQQRIIARIKELVAKMDSARGALLKAGLTLDQFRRSVLARAFSGHLTTDWRVDSAAQEPPAPASRSDGLRSCKYRIRGALPPLWGRWLLNDFITEARYGTSAKCTYDQRGLPVLRVPNIVDGKLDLSALKYGAFSSNEIKRLQLEEGDLLVCRTNGSIDLIGKAAVVEGLHRPFAFASYLIRLRLDESRLCPKYAHLFINGPIGRAQIVQQARTTAGQFNLNHKILRSLSIPVPPLAEQREIVRRARVLLDHADLIERRVEAALAQSKKALQSVLDKAFRGELVPTEAELAEREGRDYEPADALLKRVRAERADGRLFADVR